ncbi:hypothetical protein ACTWQB_16835 [Piscibacillus sp. B03]|uniref:hypothetical protein n=1 Tax=Piscibacillus sp. B03 TaxID=3457430 RepID=UPI003FCE9F8B
MHTKTLEELENDALLAISEYQYEDTSYRRNNQIVFNYLMTRINDEHEPASLDIEARIKQLVNDIYEGQLMFGYTIFLYTYQEQPSVIDSFNRLETVHIQEGAAQLLEEIMDDDIRNIYNQALEEEYKELKDDYGIGDTIMGILTATSVSFGFYLAVLNQLKQRQLSVTDTHFIESIGNSNIMEGAELSPIHFIVTKGYNKTYEHYDIYGWHCLKYTNRIGEIIWLKESQVVEVLVSEGISEADESLILDCVVHDVNTITNGSQVEIRLNRISHFLEVNDNE